MYLLLNIVYVVVWLAQAVRQFLIWTHWLQIKEYRVDRYKALLRNNSGKDELGIFYIIIKIFLFSILSFLSLSRFSSIAGVLFILLVYLDFKLASEIYGKKLRIPIFTLRIKEIIVIGSVILAALIFLAQSYLSNIFRTFLLAEMLLPILPFVGVYITKPLVDRSKRKEIEKAKWKIKKVDPTVIGVTGSYGKTTTKDFIHQLLSASRNAGKTPGSHNTEFGLARAILNNLNKDDEVFVAEYGAYKKGEIKKLTKILKPNIAVITSVEPQHIELFGSLSNIKEAKFELFESLGEGDTAIFNIANKGACDLYKKAKNELKKINIYSYSSSKHHPEASADILLTTVNKRNDGYEMHITMGSKKHILKTNIKSPFLAENILPAIFIARKLGVGWNTIKTECTRIKLPSKTMNIKNVGKDLVVIDDTHNLSPTAFEASIDSLSGYKGYEKIVITPGMIELGKHSDEIHKSVAQKMKEVGIDEVILTKGDTFGVFKKILGERVKLFDKKGNFDMFESSSNKRVVLLAGRIPMILKTMIYEN